MEHADNKYLTTSLFNKKNFSYLLKQAKGKRSINKYAIQSNVTSAHISRLIRGVINSPPQPQTLKKLADQAQNNVTYNELMEAAGYYTDLQKAECCIDPKKIKEGVEMYNIDNSWFNIAYRVAVELDEEDRKLVKEIVEVFLKHKSVKDALI